MKIEYPCYELDKLKVYRDWLLDNKPNHFELAEVELKIKYLETFKPSYVYIIDKFLLRNNWDGLKLRNEDTIIRLREDIEQRGMLHSIIVTPYLEVIDGRHRAEAIIGIESIKMVEIMVIHPNIIKT